MRIIAGRLKGAIFSSPHGYRTHPMSDKARGALFNVLGDIEDLSVLDAFAGSGALAFEALSRGAATATLIEKDKAAQRAITDNIAVLAIKNKAKLIQASANAWLRTSDNTFDLVFLDPPYDDLQTKLLVELADRIKTGGVMVISLPPDETVPLGLAYQHLATHAYGDATLAFYRRIS